MESSKFSLGLKEAIKNFFDQVKTNLEASNRKRQMRSRKMMAIMYRKFSTEHGLALTTPMPFLWKNISMK